MAESTNRVHVSPGVYASETVDMKAATNSVGVTKLAVVGETLKGPAFQPYWIASQKEFANVFGGTSTKKFQGSNFPQYELPYIANEYLSQSNQLCVVRTLGFSGYNAGPAWVITGQKSSDGANGQKYVIAVLRSRGTYKYRAEYAKLSDGGCTCQNAYDSLTFNVGELTSVASCSAPTSYNMSAVSLSEYYDLNSNGDMCSSYSLGKTGLGFGVSAGDMGKFTINVIVGASNEGVTPGSSSVSGQTVSIPVSLNPTDKDYIIKVLGTNNNDSDQPLFVESLYDVAWNDLVLNEGFDTISSDLTTYDVGYVADYAGLDAVTGILTKHDGELAKKDLGKRYLCAKALEDGTPADIEYYIFDETTNMPLLKTITNTFTFDQAKTCDVTVNEGDMFQITDGQYAGVYKSKTAQERIKNLIKSPLILGTDANMDIEKVSGLDLYQSAVCQEAQIYSVTYITDTNGKRYYVYRAYANDHVKCYEETNTLSRRGSIVYNYEDGLYYKNDGHPQKEDEQPFTYTEEFTAVATGRLYVEEANTNWKLQDVAINEDGTWTIQNGQSYRFETGPANKSYVAKIFKAANGAMVINNKIIPVSCNLNDYKSAFRYSSTPWVVSNVKGDANNINVNRLFRFHTISDGANSVTEVKVSIENIRPDEGTFDVVVRAYGDTDSSASVLERFSKCTMASGKKFIGYQIGTVDGQYESKSKYITVEVADSTAAKNSIPAGFLGYTTPLYSGATISDSVKTNVSIAPIKYNTEYATDVNKRKQYFGISDITGYDYDYFSFKGGMATLEDPMFMSHGFHLDCRMDAHTYANASELPKISVDGVEGYVFDGVSVNARTESQPNTPIISTEDNMSGSIFEDVKLRKFTMCFAGGFDGWDMYRDQRTNTDEFSYNTYKGYVNKNTGVGYAFNKFNDGASYNIDQPALTSDYYSTLAGISLLKNPEEVDINLIATPGIDTINNTKLVKEVFDILEDRADAFYIVTTPDKEMGSGDYSDEIPETEEMVSQFIDEELHSDYAATYYPWVKIEDNGEYIYLPVTRDVVRNMAQSDNGNTTQNLAPAGLTRGRVDAIRARKNLKLAECDVLYEDNINPVRTYAQDGVVIMGQKTLREEDDLLNRIDVRRCVLRMRKLIAIATLGLIFDPNDNTTAKSFKSIVSGIMEGFIKNRAISNWKMDVDESEEAKDRLEIPATIYIKPIRALEYISINFVVTNNGAYFED